ncbi:MAG: response regulator [Anaerolineales bacterium]|nr:response regulator [Anaerolineales bacterium]
MSLVNTLVLIVEDDPTQRESEVFGLRRAGHQVLSAGTVQGALACLERVIPDVVLLDLTLPDGDGLALGRLLHRAGIPFLIVSARAGAADIEQGQRAGAADYLTKPLGLPDIVWRVARLLRQVRPPA